MALTANILNHIPLIEPQPPIIALVVPLPAGDRLDIARALHLDLVLRRRVDLYRVRLERRAHAIMPAYPPLPLVLNRELYPDNPGPDGVVQHLIAPGRRAHDAVLYLAGLGRGRGGEAGQLARQAHHHRRHRRVREVQVEVVPELERQVRALEDGDSRDGGQRARVPRHVREELALVEEHRRVALLDGLALLDAEEAPVQMLLDVPDLQVALLQDPHPEADGVRGEAAGCWGGCVSYLCMTRCMGERGRGRRRRRLTVVI